VVGTKAPETKHEDKATIEPFEQLHIRALPLLPTLVTQIGTAAPCLSMAFSSTSTGRDLGGSRVSS
jgi:hypothetical protein